MCIHVFCGIQQNTPRIHSFSSVFCILLYSPTFSVEYTYTEYSFWNTVQNTHEYIARIQVYSYSLKYSVFDTHYAVYFGCIPGVFMRIHASDMRALYLLLPFGFFWLPFFCFAAFSFPFLPFPFSSGRAPKIYSTFSAVSNSKS